MKTQIPQPSPPQSLTERRIHPPEHRFQDRCRINPALRMARIGRRRVPALLALAALLASSAPCWLPGQTFTVIHSFSTGSTNYPSTNSDGEHPQCSLILSGNALYGTTYGGGINGVGTVFKVNTDGTGFTTLYDFDGNVAGGSDGARPNAGLLLSGNTLYGTTHFGGSFSCCDGTVFELNTDGTGFDTLYDFSPANPGVMNADGAQPNGCQLLMSGDTLFGTTQIGGSGGNGTVFAFNLAGGGLTTLYDFSPFSSNNKNSDGAQPIAGLVLATNGYTLYGTTELGGAGGNGTGNGTVFAINTDGTGFTTLYSFTSGHWITNSDGVVCYTNSDGARPWAGLVLSGQTLYGTAYEGGASGQGTLFKVNTDGTGFVTLHSFSLAQYPGYTNADGARPKAALSLAGNTLYGTATFGGPSGLGTVFAVNTDGSGFTVLYNFAALDGGGGDGLVLSGNALYGTGTADYTAGNGTIFSISFSPQLTITSSATGVVLNWPASYAGLDYTGYTLQSTTNLASPVWAAVASVPVVINGHNAVTNPISAAQQFYRLSQ